MTDSTDTADTDTGQQDDTKQEQTFTQADVDKAVKDRIARERAKFADYDELKAKAAGAKTLEDRLGEIEKRATDAEARALRSDIAAEYGISADDRDLFLTGADEDTIRAQATRLAERVETSKKQGNVAPSEGDTKTTGTSDDAQTRKFARDFFAT